jgi:hypothetical protein
VTRKDSLKASTYNFSGLDKESLRKAATYEMRYGKEEGGIIVWKILQDSDSINLGMPDMDGDNQFKKTLIWTKTLIWAMCSLHNSSLPLSAMPK